MSPHPNVKEPQHENCADCPKNEWGSADRGRGKACSNVRRLAVMAASDIENAESINEAEVRALKLSVMNVKPWASYVKNTLPELKRPVWGVVTKVKVQPDPKSQHKFSFAFVNLIEFNEETYVAMKKKVAEAEKQLRQPYPDKTEEDTKPAKGQGKKLPQAGKKR